MVAEQQTCFSEFCFAPYTGLGSEWVQLQLKRSFALWLWWGARCASSVGAWPGGCHVPRMRVVPQSARPKLYLIVPCNVPKTVRVSEGKMALIPFGYAKLC